MATKKKKSVKGFTEETFVTPEVTSKAYNILSDEEETKRELILDLRDKGFDTNRIAARVEMRKDLVEQILNQK